MGRFPALLLVVLSGCGPLVFGPPPRIDSFTADESTVGWGAPVQLRWKVRGATSFSLSGVGNVGSGGALVRPTGTTNYVLTARGLGGVAVSAPLAISTRESLQIAAGLYRDGGAPGTVFLARLRDAAGAPLAEQAAIEIDADAPGFPLRFSCAAGAKACELRAPLTPPVAGYRATAQLSTRALSTSFPLSPGFLEPPREVRATAAGVTWQPVADAAAYRVQAVDFTQREAKGAPVVVHGTTAPLPAAGDGVWVEALAADPASDSVALPAPHVARATAFVSAGGDGGSGAAWQLFAPQDFSGSTLTARFPALGADERLAVLLVNAGGKDLAQATVSASGTLAPAAQQAPPALASGALRARAATDLHEALRSAQEPATLSAIAGGIAAPSPRALSDHPSFCTVRGLDFGDRVRKPATRVFETDHAVFFADDEDLSHYSAFPDFWTTLGQLFEQRIYPTDTAAFGPASDVDQNGKLFIFFTHELGAHLGGGWLIGYFGNNDLLREADDSAGCSGTGSNHADMLYMNDVANGLANGYAEADLAGSIFPATMAHELQHLINLNRRCLLQPCSAPQETWLNEGLSKVAEDLTGFGWNGAQGRWEGSEYLTRSAGTLRGYDGRSLTIWEGDPIGNYQGSHSFMRYFADHVPALLQDLSGGDAVEHALGMPLPRAMAEWSTALLLSNESFNQYSYLGQGWSPFHDRLRHLDYQDLPAAGAGASLRTDGVSAFVSGAGQGGAASITVQSNEAVKPHVVVVRFSGALPR